jgi:hypothetical protein
MNMNLDDPNEYPVPLPTLSDEAVIQIRSFIEHVLDQFDVRYGAQVWRYYEDRAEHNMLRPPPRTVRDDPPF